VSFTDGGTIAYTYAADGTKLRTVHSINGTITTKDYCGSVIYENGAAKLWQTEAGYISMNDSKYHYYLQDHQGNNRVVVSEAGATEEINHYYAFGGLFGNSNSVQPFKYNGKELDAQKGLNWYDYGARQYDAALGRWFAVDPLAEKYFNLSPYTYCNNLPIRYIDPTGEDWKDAWPYLKNSINVNVSIGLKGGLEAKIPPFKVGAEINAGSIEAGNEGLKFTQGIGANFGFIGASIQEAVYNTDKYLVAKDHNTSVDIAGFSFGHETTTTYDSTGKYFKEVNTNAEVETSYSADFAIAAGIGIDLSINLLDIWNFIINLFE
jgi:RHS repeat-associated protein